MNVDAVLTILSIGLVIFIFGGRRLQRLFKGRISQPAAPQNAAEARSDGHRGIVEGAASLPAPLSKASWLALVNDKPDELPSMMIIAPPGSGKTEIAREILKHRRGAKLIIDPKRKAGKWSKQPYVARDKDGSLSSIKVALQAVYNEMMSRLQQDHATSYEELTVLIDEYNIIADEDKELPPIIKKLYQLGREYRIRVIICAQSELVQDLGINSRNRDGFTFLYLGDRAIDKTIAAREMRYPACIEWKNTYPLIDNTTLDLNDTLPITGIWRAELANMNVPDRQTDKQTQAITAPNTLIPSVCLETKEDVVQFLVRQGWGVGKVREIIKGDNKALGEMVKRFEVGEEI